MSDTLTSSENNTAAITTPLAAPRRKQTRGLLNQAQLRHLTKCETITQTAQQTAYAPALEARDISEDFLSKLADDTSAARAKAAEALQHTANSKAATVDELKAAKALIAGMQEVQKAAKQKYARTNRMALDKYFIGKKLNGSRPNLLQTSQTILDNLAEDTLPGITSAKVKSLNALRLGWIAAKSLQTNAHSSARTARAELKTMLKSLSDRRLSVQLAADAEWPHNDEESAAIRRDFSLPRGGPIKA